MISEKGIEPTYANDNACLINGELNFTYQVIMAHEDEGGFLT